MAALGLGAAWLGVIPGAGPEAQDAAAVAAVHRAIELGIDYVDTAPLYGESERRVGLALSMRTADGTRWRDRVRLVTKTGTHPARRGDYSAAATRWSVENSLRELRTGYLDGVLVHDPADMEPVLGPRGAMDVLCGLKEQGVVGFIGIGVHGHGQLRTAIRDGRFDLIQTTYDFSLMRTSAIDEIVPLAAAHGLAIVNASPFHGGLLAAASEERLDEMERIRDWKSAAADLERARTLHRWAAAEGIDLRALALQFSLREPRFCVTLVGPRTVAEVEENVAAASAPLPADAWERLERIWPQLPPASPGGEAR